MSILQNAIDSIALGVEDYNSSDPRRLISCTRNLFAGILLLFKHKLAEISPPNSNEALIKQKIFPVTSSSGEVIWRGQGKKTVGVRQIQDRFQSLNLSVDWDRVKKINEYRNDIEHYHSPLSHNSVKVLIADSFIVIRDFVRIHLGEEPFDLLGSETWEVLTSVAEVYDKEKKECTDHVESINFDYPTLLQAIVEFRCSECGSGLIDAAEIQSDCSATEFYCRSCGETWNFNDLAEDAISSYYYADNYIALTDGGDLATIECPHCGLATYVLDEDVCVVCGESSERTCMRCSMEIIPEEIDGSGLCSYCAHMMSKDD